MLRENRPYKANISFGNAAFVVMQNRALTAHHRKIASVILILKGGDTFEFP